MYKTLKKYLLILSVVIAVFFLLKPRSTGNRAEYIVLERHSELASQCNMDSLLIIYKAQSYHDWSKRLWEEKGALCGFLYFELLFLKRFKRSSIEEREEIKQSLLNEKKHIKQAEILLKKIKEIEKMESNIIK